MTKFALVGAPGKDLHYKIKDFRELPPIFRKYRSHSVPFSKIQELFGVKWNVERVMSLLERLAINPGRGNFSYGGRAFTVACQAAKLGADVTIIGEVGNDFNTVYEGFFDGSYKDHIEKSGVSFSILSVDMSDRVYQDSILLRKILNEIPSIKKASILQFARKEIATILDVKDISGNDIYFFDDTKAASLLSHCRPVPTQLLKKLDGVFITSGDTNLNLKMARESRQMDLIVLFDVGLFEATRPYLRAIVPHTNILLGNTKEIDYVCSAFDCSSVNRLFAKTKDSRVPEVIIQEDKINGKLTLYKRKGKKKITIGPIKLKKSGSSTGVCDCIGAGFLAFYSKGCSLLDSCKAGLSVGSAIWEVEGVHEGFMNQKELEERWRAHWGSSISIKK